MCEPGMVPMQPFRSRIERAGSSGMNSSKMLSSSRGLKSPSPAIQLGSNPKQPLLQVSVASSGAGIVCAIHDHCNMWSACYLCVQQILCKYSIH